MSTNTYKNTSTGTPEMEPWEVPHKIAMFRFQVRDRVAYLIEWHDKAEKLDNDIRDAADVEGAEFDQAAFEAVRSFFKRWLSDAREVDALVPFLENQGHEVERISELRERIAVASTYSDEGPDCK